MAYSLIFLSKGVRAQELDFVRKELPSYRVGYIAFDKAMRDTTTCSISFAKPVDFSKTDTVKVALKISWPTAALSPTSSLLLSMSDVSLAGSFKRFDGLLNPSGHGDSAVDTISFSPKVFSEAINLKKVNYLILNYGREINGILLNNYTPDLKILEIWRLQLPSNSTLKR
jgi:hypothetical protein